ncbi:MAG: ShlB/FhaC/HecB family hemolysin secretion/activation protein, partial [Ramlibacter sp.]|nr:ShlB/FhaC/HecB family hemolysin secretion/activation protein [Ramlibacter sp.]
MSPQVFVPFALLALVQAATAQQPPSAGGQMQQIPPTPVAPRAAPQTSIQPQAAPATEASDAVKITVRALRVAGAQVYSEPELV